MPYPNHTPTRRPVASGRCNRPAVDRFIRPALISRDGPYAYDAWRQHIRTITTNAVADTDRHTYVYDRPHAFSACLHAIRYTYGPYGECSPTTGTFSEVNPQQSASYRPPATTDFHYYGLRYYDPTIGRWLSEDPIGEDGGENLFGFVANEPIQTFDPSGSVGMDQWIADWKVYGPDLNGRFGGLQGTGGLEAVILDADGTTTGVINDQFGNGVASVSGGSVTWFTTRVGAYGPLPGIQAQTLTDVTQLAAATAWRSRRMDPTGFYCLGARYYEPTSGRFLSADPMGQTSSPSLYDFAGGDPVNFFDPDGRLQTSINNFGSTINTQIMSNVFPDVNAVNNFNDPNNTARARGEFDTVIIYNAKAQYLNPEAATAEDFQQSAFATSDLDPTDTTRVPAENFASILRQFKDIPDASISRLDIEGHDVNLNLLPIQTIGNNVPLTPDQMAQLAPKLAPGAIVTLYGCGVGANQQYLNDMSAASHGAMFYGPTGPYSYNTADKNGRYAPLQNPVDNPAFAHSQ